MVKIPRFDIYDFALMTRAQSDNPFRVAVTATFEHTSGAKIEGVPGFYDGQADGSRRYVVRFSPPLEGMWRGRTTSEDPALDGVWLEPIEVSAATNSLAHGVVGIDPGHPLRFAYADGAPFVYMGFECDWLFAYHQRDADRCEQAVALIADRGFSAVVTNVYAHTGFSGPDSSFTGEVLPGTIYGPPDLYVFGGTNEEPDHTSLNLAFFHDFDGMMRQLLARGVVAHLMLQVQNKHVAWPERGTPEDEAYWRYVVARYQAFGNIIWDVGKESYNLLAETGSHAYTESRIDLIREVDVYDHLVTVHDSEAGSAGRVSQADAASDLVSDQIHLADVARYNREAVHKQQILPKPYLNIEYGYELGVEDLKTYRSRTTAPWQDVLKWTYALYVAGAYPCYYYSNVAWDLIRFDPEPPGWIRYRYLRDLLDALPFNRMAPANDLVDRGYCLADPGKSYMVYLPEGGDAVVDLTAVPSDRGPRGQFAAKEVPLGCTWMDIYSGERQVTDVTPTGWLTEITNPFGDRGQPCVLVIDVPTL